MSSFLDLIAPETESAIRNKIRGFAITAKLMIDNWRTGGVGQQMFEMNVAMTEFFTRAVAKAIRGTAALDTSVDPGDEDQYDSINATLAPVPGYLSALGENVHGVTRSAETFASGSITFTNANIAGAEARTIEPYGVVFNGTTIDGITPTYHNTPDTTIYTDPGGTITIPVGTSLEIPIECDFAGAIGTRATGLISLSTTLIGCTATNANPVSGNDRENAQQYRETCRAASARLSIGGPGRAYDFLARKNLDGTPLLNGSGNETGITRVFTSSDSATGEVTCYYASASGAPLAEDVIAANENIESECMATPDAITFTGTGALEVNVHVVGTARIRLVAGLDVATIKESIVEKLAEQWALFPIGGVDQDGTGAGFIYIADAEGIARSAYSGLYNVDCGLDGYWAIPAGRVAVLQNTVSDWTITVVS